MAGVRKFRKLLEDTKDVIFQSIEQGIFDCDTLLFLRLLRIFECYARAKT